MPRCRPTKASSRRSCETSSRTPRSSPERGEIRLAATGRAGRHGPVLGGRHRDRHRPGDQRPGFRGIQPGGRAAPRTVKGTGLGLPLSRNWPTCWAVRFPCKRSGRRLDVRRRHPAVFGTTRGRPDPVRSGTRPAPVPVLVVEEDPVDLLLYEKLLEGAASRSCPRPDPRRGAAMLRRVRPRPCSWTSCSMRRAGEPTVAR